MLHGREFVNAIHQTADTCDIYKIVYTLFLKQYFFSPPRLNILFLLSILSKKYFLLIFTSIKMYDISV